jgi:hypothetical protein
VLRFLSPHDVLKAQLGHDRHRSLRKLSKVVPRLVHGPVVLITGMAKEAEPELKDGARRAVRHAWCSAPPPQKVARRA